MSAETELNVPVNAEEVPAYDSYTPMPTGEPEDKRKRYDSTADGIKDAAKEVSKARDAAEPRRLQTDEKGIIERTYHRLADGSPIPLNETISAEKGAEDLTKVRLTDLQSANPSLQTVADAVDGVRSEYQAWQAGQYPNQPQPQPAAQPDPQMQAQQPTEQQQPGIHPDVLAALQNENVRNALAAEVAHVEQARQQYAQGARAAATMAAASLLASFPELANVPTDQLQTAVATIGQVNPQRAQQIMAHLERVQNLHNASQQAEAARQQIQQQRFQQYIEAENAKFEASIANEDPATMQRLKEATVDIAEKEYGVSRQELAALWRSQPLMHTAAFQRMMVDATRYHLAMRDAAAKVSKPVPPVQRPGTAQPRASGDEAAVRSALAKFNSDPTPLNAAALLNARRSTK